jgi:S-adenosylmethionine synthetase
LIKILQSAHDSVATLPMEVVERKGLGHPDTICDAAMEQVAVALAQAYRETCGRILHFNADKGMLVAGAVDCRPGGGAVLEPMRLVIGDRATFEWQCKRLPIEDIAVRAVQEWFKSRLRHVNPAEHLRCQVELRPGSTELRTVTDRDGVYRPRFLGQCCSRIRPDLQVASLGDRPSWGNCVRQVFATGQRSS